MLTTKKQKKQKKKKKKKKKKKNGVDMLCAQLTLAAKWMGEACLCNAPREKEQSKKPQHVQLIE